MDDKAVSGGGGTQLGGSYVHIPVVRHRARVQARRTRRSKVLATSTDVRDTGQVVEGCP